MNEQNITVIPKTLYYVGEILNLILVFDPVNPEIQRLMTTDFKLPQLSIEEGRQVRQSFINQDRPMVRKESDKDVTFEGLTGSQQLQTLDGIVAMLMGLFEGTGMVADIEGLNLCEDTIRWGIINNG